MARYCAFILILTVIVFSVTNVAYGEDRYCERYGLKIKPGESASVPGKCQEVTCNEDLSLFGKVCAEFITGPECHQSEIDYSKPYPECCPHSVCSDDVYCVQDDIKIKKGESATLPGKCEKFTCHAINSVELEICGPTAIKQGCHMSETDHSKPYPECCPHEVC